MWEGRCAPENEPCSQTVVKPTPDWDGMKYDRTPSALGVTPLFERAYIGGGCARLQIENGVADACNKYEVQLSVRPSWGSLDIRDGDYLINDLEFIEGDAVAGALARLLLAEAGAICLNILSCFKLSAMLQTDAFCMLTQCSSHPTCDDAQCPLVRSHPVCLTQR